MDTSPGTPEDGGRSPSDAGTPNEPEDAALPADAEVPPTALTITSLSPTRGAVSGGTPVLIAGTGFGDGTLVRFGDASATSVTALTSEVLQVITPPGSAGTVDVTVERAGVVSTAAQAFTYTEAMDCRFVASTPGAGGVDQAITSQVQVTFSDPLDETTLAGVGISTVDGQAAPASISLGEDGRTIVITPESTLRFWKTYQVTWSGLTNKNAQPCEDAAVAFSTVQPAEVPQPTGGAAVQRMAQSGSFLYAVSRTFRGIQVYDTTTPTAPTIVGELRTAASPSGIAVLGSRAYLAMGTAGVLVVDVSSPAAPRTLATVGTLGSANDVIAYDFEGKPYLGIADGTEGVRIVDASDPGYERTVAVIDPSRARANDARSLELSDDGVLVIANGNRGLSWVDLRVPSAPTLLATVVPNAQADGTARDAVIDVARDGTFTFALFPTRLRVAAYSTTDAAAPTLLGEAGDCGGPCVERGLSLVRDGSTLLVATQRGGVVSLSYGANGIPSTKQNGWIAPVPVFDVLFTSTHLWAGTEGGLAVFDRATPSAPLWTDASAPGVVRGVVASGDHLYAAGSTRGLFELSTATDAEQPSFVARYDTTGSPAADTAARATDAAGDVVVVADGRSGLDVFTGAAGAKQLAGHLALPDNTTSVLLRDGLAITCNNNQGFSLVDLSTPSAPVLLATRKFEELDPTVTSDRCNGTDLVGNTLYVAARGGLWVIDVSNRAAPAFLGRYAVRSTDQLSAVVVRDNVALVAGVLENLESPTGRTAHLLTFDVSEPSAITRVGRSDDLGGATALRAVDRLLFVASVSTGVQVFDISTPSAPVWEGRIPTAGDAVGLYTSADALYVAMSAGGVGVVHTGTVTPSN